MFLESFLNVYVVVVHQHSSGFFVTHKDNGYEEVEEGKCAEGDEKEKVEERDELVTAANRDPSGRLEVIVLRTCEAEVVNLQFPLGCKVDLVPVVACYSLKKHKHGFEHVLEVKHVVQRFLQLNVGEQLHAQHGEHEHEQQQ